MDNTNEQTKSPFLQCGTIAQVDQLAVLHLRRDLLLPTILRSEDRENEGYLEGKVTNTRFGSFPHSTLIGAAWGSQVRASLVDTGSRGRRREPRSGQKRKRDSEKGDKVDEADVSQDTQQPESLEVHTPQQASTGFVHVLPPTPEIWTASLPHRTQVVYTSDYSYILHRLRARPGVQIIEAGAGSGSFTHAAARAVFGQDAARARPSEHQVAGSGRVWSFEFHDQRVEKLRQEVADHVLADVVTVTHRDVYEEGFVLEDISKGPVKANAVFLDLPAPWLALRHLDRGPASPLDPSTAIHLCTFSPCVEQVQKTVATLRQMGWLEIEAVELSAKRIEVRRERGGIREEGLRGANDFPATVEEAICRLTEFERKITAMHSRVDEIDKHGHSKRYISKQQRLQNIKDAQMGRKLYKEGQLLTRAESELKTHTSYLVFALLPSAWSEEDERSATRNMASSASWTLTNDMNGIAKQQKSSGTTETGVSAKDGFENGG